MNNHSPSNNATLEDNNARLLHLYNNKRKEGGLPTLKKSISRNTLLLNNSLSPTRPLFNNPKADGRQLTVETAVFPENPQPLFQNDSTITKRSSSTPVATVKFCIFNICTK